MEENSNKTFNLNYLVSVLYSPLSKTKHFYYEEGNKGNWLRKPTESGYKSLWDDFLNDPEIRQELPHPYIGIEKEAFVKPSITLKFINGEEKVIYYETNKEAQHEYLIYQSNIPNPLKFSFEN